MVGLKLYKISQDVNTDYDTYDSAVVAAENEDEARNIHPSDNKEWGKRYSGWCKTPKQVSVKYLGIADENIEKGVILASFFPFSWSNPEKYI